MKKTCLCLLLCSFVSAVPGAEETNSPLAQGEVMAKDFHFYRSSLTKKTGIVNIAPEGVFLSKNTCGEGLYTVTFALNESHEKFQYHQPRFVFYFNPPVQNADPLKAQMREGAEYLYVVWRKSGLVEFIKHFSSGKTKKCGVWIKPGPEKDSAYEKDTFVTMNLIVPAAGDYLKIYLNKAPTGVPDCEFQMPPMTANGQFGFYNPKWYSLIHVKDISYAVMEP